MAVSLCYFQKTYSILNQHIVQQLTVCYSLLHQSQNMGVHTGVDGI